MTSGRGYCGVGLHMSKHSANVGQALRAVGCWGADFLAVSGRRYRKHPTDTMKVYRHVPLFQADDLLSLIPYDCVPVAVERVEGAECLSKYAHPERAFYVFGPEDGHVGPKIRDRCRDVVSIPSGCLNLAAAVNVVLYDRAVKRSSRLSEECERLRGQVERAMHVMEFECLPDPGNLGCAILAMGEDCPECKLSYVEGQEPVRSRPEKDEPPTPQLPPNRVVRDDGKPPTPEQLVSERSRTRTEDLLFAAIFFILCCTTVASLAAGFLGLW